jgi:hypothetical protein
MRCANTDLMDPAPADTTPPRTNFLWQRISQISLGVLVAVLALKLTDRLARRTDPLPVIPVPNGYDTLLTIAREVRVPHGDLVELDHQAIRQLGQTNREALKRLAQALNAQTGVPLRLEPHWGEKHAEDVKRLKRLAVVLGVQSRAESLDGNTNASARCLLEIILLGQVMGRGGILSDGINAMTIETLGAGTFRGQISHLDAETCRAAAQELERSESCREEPEQTLKTQRSWSFASLGLVGRIADFSLRKDAVKRDAEFIRRHQEVVRRTRRLMVSLAARAVELNTGHPVSSPSELVPAVLKAVPLDPETRTPITAIAASPP